MRYSHGVLFNVLHTSSLCTFNVLFFPSFDLSLVEMFEHLIGPRSFENPQGALACCQFFLPISLKGVGFISLTYDVPVTFLSNWDLVTSTLASKNLLN